jgi:predicted membrane channel-forming protein YqfA (hemolysin III family)
MRFGPLLVAFTGTALIALELLRPRDGGPSVFWLIVGGLALVLGVVGYLQRHQKPPEPPLPRL